MTETVHEEGKPSVLFVIPNQFGYSAGYYYYCKYLLDAGFRVGMISLDLGKQKIELEGEFSSLYVEPRNIIQYRIELMRLVKLYSAGYDVVVFKQMPGVSIFSLMVKRKRRILDIRSGSIHNGWFRKWIENIDISLQSLFFRKIFILSKELAKELRIPPKKYIWLPLGADDITKKEKIYSDSLRLLYVGTFNGRNIHQAIEGYALFKKQHKGIEASYDIIGSGDDHSTNRILDTIKLYDIQREVVLHGYMTHQEAESFYEKCNIGVSYIPVIPCYQNQPPTKTYEYILSGLVCIATDTLSNKQLITEQNGILHHDNPESFSQALEDYYMRRGHYRTDQVKNTLNDYLWKSIVNRILIPEFCRMRN